jgi:hypothetical protein
MAIFVQWSFFKPPLPKKNLFFFFNMDSDSDYLFTTRRPDVKDINGL